MLKLATKFKSRKERMIESVEGPKDRLRLISEAKIALRAQRAQLGGSDYSDDGSSVPMTHSMSRNNHYRQESPTSGEQSPASEVELEDGSKITFERTKPPRIPTPPRGRGSMPKVVTATGTRTERRWRWRQG